MQPIFFLLMLLFGFTLAAPIIKADTLETAVFKRPIFSTIRTETDKAGPQPENNAARSKAYKGDRQKSLVGHIGDAEESVSKYKIEKKPGLSKLLASLGL
ncbi:hypothetical protein N7499_000242 [Penicillium canescens]|uniref:RxLR effector protein n=1 Tax=Penicillium canescens TaxID=5083 RepID=A0AAD6IHE9_PENCN|nr:uncharacterized protein N7446_011558 [Penicillium canescens]KAJ6004172.1 hypothetical protein N7522_005817 [Penicillium canescens]KAJ6029098.1 hypothetical protein N7444_012085 [Penicillium canescens]KAJ6047530.1 hypothetical protein N7460_003677 [Penicillium canescens]KAJ6048875.1 hypothetical protein N7446_011558 [Penicillium canescens]KAJ6100612.1 hypothetical protein N7499_000242 [Penicillium canescens]